MNTAGLIVERLMKQLFIHTEADLAELMGISKNALSMLKYRDSVGTLLEHATVLGKAKSISLDALLLDDQKLISFHIEAKKASSLCYEFEIKHIKQSLMDGIYDRKNIDYLLELLQTGIASVFIVNMAEIVRKKQFEASPVLFKFVFYVAYVTPKNFKSKDAKAIITKAIKTLETFYYADLNRRLLDNTDKEELLKILNMAFGGDEDFYNMFLMDIVGAVKQMNPNYIIKPSNIKEFMEEYFIKPLENHFAKKEAARQEALRKKALEKEKESTKQKIKADYTLEDLAPLWLTRQQNK